MVLRASAARNGAFGLAEHNNVLVPGSDRLWEKFHYLCAGQSSGTRGPLGSLPATLATARRVGDGAAERQIRALAGASVQGRLLILDDWLMAKLIADQRRNLMEVIDDRQRLDGHVPVWIRIGA